jgi:hypothetical protein
MPNPNITHLLWRRQTYHFYFFILNVGTKSTSCKNLGQRSGHKGKKRSSHGYPWTMDTKRTEFLATCGKFAVSMDKSWLLLSVNGSVHLSIVNDWCRISLRSSVLGACDNLNPKLQLALCLFCMTRKLERLRIHSRRLRSVHVRK